MFNHKETFGFIRNMNEAQKLEEKRNPENDEINAKIKNPTENKEELQKLGYEVKDDTVINPKTGRQVDSNTRFNSIYATNGKRDSYYDDEKSIFISGDKDKDKLDSFDAKGYLDTDRNNDEKYSYYINKRLGKKNRVSKEKGMSFEEYPNRDSAQYRRIVRDRDYRQEEYQKAQNMADALKTNVDAAENARKEILNKRGIKTESEKVEHRKTALERVNTKQRRITEATHIKSEEDVNEVRAEYKEAYGFDLDLNKVPCVKARDKFLSGWGQAQGKNHYQFILCGDASEAATLCDNIKRQAAKEGLANVTWGYGVKIPKGASFSYIVGKNATAWK